MNTSNQFYKPKMSMDWFILQWLNKSSVLEEEDQNKQTLHSTCASQIACSSLFKSWGETKKSVFKTKMQPQKRQTTEPRSTALFYILIRFIFLQSRLFVQQEMDLVTCDLFRKKHGRGGWTSKCALPCCSQFIKSYTLVRFFPPLKIDLCNQWGVNM